MKRTLEQELIAWKERKEHLPILLRGARQVGKSYLVEQFGKAHFENLAVVDFEHRPELKKAFSTRDPQGIIAQLELALGHSIQPGKTLLFLDEIQLCPEALASLRYFKEKLSALHVIAASSLLEFLLHDEEFSFPVGRVDFLYLRPFSFLEYLQAANPFLKERLEKFSWQRPPTPLEHQEILKWVRRYFFVGGMPAAIQASLDGASLTESQRVHDRILQAYASDFGKYGKRTQHKYLEQIFQKGPSLIAQILKYKNLDSEGRSRELKPALDLLCHAGLFQRVYGSSAAGLPLHAHMHEHRLKLLYLDIGLLQTATKVDAKAFFDADLLQINAGMLAEQFVGQELIAYQAPYQNSPLFFWEKETGGQAEIDYLLSSHNSIIPVEVKAGATGSLRSLHLFLKEKESPVGIRISELPLSLHNKVLSLPFYFLPWLTKFLDTRE